MSRIERIGNNITLYLGDCREILPALGRVDAVVTDPPYGVGKDYGDLVKDNLETFQNAIQIVSDTGLPSAAFVPVSRLYDMPVRPQWTTVWTKTWGGSALLAYPIYPHWEAIALFNVKGDFKGNNGHRSDVFHFAPVRADPDGHPTPKPDDLMYELVRFMRGDTILDPYMGSGTTGVACIKQGRQFVGIEINPKFFDIACRRIEAATRQPDMFVEQQRSAPKQESWDEMWAKPYTGPASSGDTNS